MSCQQFNGQLTRRVVALGWFAIATSAHAQTVTEPAPVQVTSGLKAALEKGVHYAVDQLGRSDGFMGNEKVRIPLPGFLDDTARLLRALGQRQRVDELLLSMNRAAEAAVPLARDLLLSAVRGMTVQDAAKILVGGETSLTEFFARSTRTPLTAQLLPVVTRTTEKTGLAARYNRLAEKAATYGLIRPQDARLEDYVTGKTLDGIYFMIGEQEKAIRRDPVAAGSRAITAVFGGLR